MCGRGFAFAVFVGFILYISAAFELGLHGFAVLMFGCLIVFGCFASVCFAGCGVCGMVYLCTLGVFGLC